MAYTGRLLPKGGPLCGFRYMKGQGFYSLKYMKGQENLSLGSVKGLKGRTDEFYGVIKQGKRSICVIDSYLNDNAFRSSLKGCKVLNEVYERGTICQQTVYERGTFFVKMVFKRVRDWTSGRSLPVSKFVEYPPGNEAAVQFAVVKNAKK